MSPTKNSSGEFQQGKFWFERVGDTLVVGLTDVALTEAGEIEAIELPDVGSESAKGEVLVSIFGSLDTLELIAPASGNVEEVNDALSDDPQIASEDPLEAGWLVKIEVADDESDEKKSARDEDDEEDSEENDDDFDDESE